MGLDMYAFARPGAIDQAADFDQHPGDIEIAYWRKHPNLHGWMERLYRERGGTDLQFNCAQLKLTPDDIDRLEKDVTNDALPPTAGFFFGASSAEDKKHDLGFIASARAAFAEGQSVYYTSWW